jgi:hypothetical protein
VREYVKSLQKHIPLSDKSRPLRMCGTKLKSQVTWPHLSTDYKIHALNHMKYAIVI